MHHPVVVDPPDPTVDPRKAQRFLDQVVIDRTVEAARLLAVDDLETFLPVGV